MKTFIKLTRTDKALFILRGYALLLGLFVTASLGMAIINTVLYFIK